jgi:hypothetical protein
VNQFIKGFVRDRHGVWRCVAPANLATAQGRIQVTPDSERDTRE